MGEVPGCNSIPNSITSVEAVQVAHLEKHPHTRTKCTACWPSGTPRCAPAHPGVRTPDRVVGRPGRVVAKAPNIIAA